MKTELSWVAVGLMAGFCVSEIGPLDYNTSKSVKK